jgi:hypothetical protein
VTTAAPTTDRKKPSAEEVKERLRLKRTIECVTPSGVEVVIRPVNLERHALAGGLPAKLKAIAQGGVEAIDKAIEQATSGDPETLEYLDGLVCEVFITPAFKRPRYAREDDGDTKKGDLISGDALDEYLLPADYRWALLVAYGEEDRDGEGRLLWGREPLSRWATFREEHGCAADCEACITAQGRLSVPSAR